jgi:carbohydrate-selective porin OprB
MAPVNVDPSRTSGTSNTCSAIGAANGLKLAEARRHFDFNNIGDFLTDVTGSQTHHATYFGRFRFTTDIDFNKLSGFDGEFFFSPIWQYGRNLSGDYLHVNTLTSSIAGVKASASTSCGTSRASSTTS